jgi:hypothetical protein
MDRRTAERSVHFGLVLGGLAICIFALTLVLGVLV